MNKTSLTVLATIALFITALALPVVAFAASASITEACAGLNQLPDGSCSNNGNAAISIANKGVNLLSIVAGIIAVIMLIVAGFQYITSAGDASKVGKAKNALIYTLIALLVVGLAQFLVHVVLTETSKV